ncbi:MAG: hypothetical protein J2P22_00960 [Nocardioides sp.]|nr:hypothetical protein [Nocardioides sp.]
MRAQRDRDEQTVLIGTALGVFALVMVAEGLALWLLHSTFDIAIGRAVTGGAVVIAGTVAIMNLVRSEKG